MNTNQDLSTKILPDHLASFVEKMQNDGLDSEIIDSFTYYYRKVVNHEKGFIHDKDIIPVKPEEIPDLNGLEDYAEAGKKVMNQTVMIVLNGGLGTSMGLTGPKSLIKIKHDKTFLEFKMEDSKNLGIKLVLMNSFRTHEKTLSAIHQMGIKNQIDFPLSFLQYKFPKINRNDLSPAVWPKAPSLEWNPPGHGDIYSALFSSKMIHKLLAQNIRYAFISNSDNLGARVDKSLLGYFSKNDLPFLMEITQRRPLDAKGGHLAKHKNGRLILREIAQCPEEELEAFQDINKYRFFNTNNLWIDLVFLKDYVSKYKRIYLPLILKPGKLDPRDDLSPDIFQVETAMGAAISMFEGASAVKVSKARFMPVKGHNDLLAIWSDCYMIKKNKGLVLDPARENMLPISISLDPEFYRKIDMFFDRFKDGPPSLLQCESLTVKGNIFFEKDVKIIGKVHIENTKDTPAVIPKGTVVKNDIWI
jgi:UTP--glucose-1-phosphate uridylyltransferase